MFDLDAAVDRWIQENVANEPDLAPHANEIADHLSMVGRSLMADGVAGPDALTEAVRGLGSTSELAGEFRKRGSAVAYLRNLVEAETEPSRRDQQVLAGAWIGLSLLWAAVMIVFENQTWGLFGWTLTTYLPLSVLGVLISKRTQESDCEGRGRLHRLLRRF